MNSKFRSNESVEKIIILMAFGTVLLLAGFLRFKNISSNPGWYSDEGTLVEIAQNLLTGNASYLGLNSSTLIAARLPLFPWLLSLIFKIFPQEIQTLRYFSAGLGVLATALLYFTIRNMEFRSSNYLALAAAFFYAIFPQAVLFSRIGFSYNLLAPIIIIIIWISWKYLENPKRGLAVLAGLMIGIGSLSDLIMLSFVIPVILIVISRGIKNALISGLAAFVPISVYGFAGLINSPEAYLFDAGFTFFRLRQVPIIAQYPCSINYFVTLIGAEYWWALAVVGFFLIRNERLKKILLLLFLFPLLSLGRTTCYPGLGLYYLIPLLPLVSVGVGSLFVFGIPEVLRFINQSLDKYLGTLGWQKENRKKYKFRKFVIFITSAIIIFTIAFSVPVITLTMDLSQVSSSLKSEYEPILLDPIKGKLAQSYINSAVEPWDLVVTSPTIAWGIDSRTTDFQLTLAYNGIETKHFPPDIPKDRFDYSLDYKSATYIVIDPVWKNWAVPNMEEVASMTSEIEQWPLVYFNDQVEIYRNPDTR